MKTFIISLCTCVICNVSFAVPKDVALSKIKIPNPNGPSSCIPNVQEDGDDVTITCDSIINNVDVVIRDQYGNVMHQSTLTIGPNETTLYVPSTDGDSEKTTIDLYYDRKHLSGYFDE